MRSGQVQGITHDGSEHNSPETEELRTVLVAVAAPEDVGRANPEDALQAALPVALVALGLQRGVPLEVRCVGGDRHAVLRGAEANAEKKSWFENDEGGTCSL